MSRPVPGLTQPVIPNPQYEKILTLKGWQSESEKLLGANTKKYGEKPWT
jgi:hypothetical protein